MFLFRFKVINLIFSKIFAHDYIVGIYLLVKY